jgi:glycosyltransferase involved in cell wall biosynthesis
MSDPKLRVLAIATHPVQYQAPMFRRIATRSDVDLRVAYLSLRGAEAAHDPEFGATVRWDVPLLEGYSWEHLRNRGSGTESVLGLFNPGLWRLIRQENFDAILCYVGYPRASFWISLLAAKRSGTAFLFGTDTTTLTPRDAKTWKSYVKKVVWPRLFRMADQVIVPSSGTQELMRSLGIAEDRITLAPYSVDNDWWMSSSAQVDREAVRTSWGATSVDTVILFCAKLQSWKRPADLLRAFAKARADHMRLIFAGEGPLRSTLEKEASALGVADRVRFIGFVNQSQLPAVYKSADVMVLPSEYEPFGVVVNEAMCCGCPVIASDRVGAAQDLVEPVAPEFIFPCGDIDALAGLLMKVAGDDRMLEETRQRGFDRIRVWSPERNIQATIEAMRRGMARLGKRVAAEMGPTESASSSTDAVKAARSAGRPS